MADKSATLQATWLDAILAVPLIGLRPARPWQMPGARGRVLEKFVSSVKTAASGYSVMSDGMSIQTAKGLTIGLQDTNLTIAFKYSPHQERQPGTLGELAFPERIPYSLILEEELLASGFLLEALGDEVQFNRVGVMAHCGLAEDGIPPGIKELIEKVERVAPWSLRKTEFSLLGLLVDNEGVIDQCHHIVRFDRSSDKPEVEITLDWQRVTADGKRLPVENPAEHLDQCARLALAHFERIGLGDFDAK